MPIIIKSDDEIAIMRHAGSVVAQTLQRLVEHVQPGVVVKDLDK
ncbi:MAG: type I methionyl aminopeptidase, partial [Dehalococcoidia bacterium]